MSMTCIIYNDMTRTCGIKWFEANKDFILESAVEVSWIFENFPEYSRIFLKVLVLFASFGEPTIEMAFGFVYRLLL